MKLSLRFNSILLFSAVLLSCNSSSSNQNEEKNEKGAAIVLTEQRADQKVDVTIDGKPFTTFCYSDTLMKQILYPIYTSGGNFVTRGWPISPRSGEHTDHPHQRGMWLNYGDVNGYDFWGNSYEIPADVRATKKGKIKHIEIESLNSGNGEGTLVTHESWVSPYGTALLNEKTTYHFIAKDDTRIIDRITTLTANDSTVTFKDTKEGMFAIRYNKDLHLPSKKAMTFVDAMGNETIITPDSKITTGNYLSSEGVTGEAVWSTKARWMNLYGTIENENVSIVICDHPKNFDYPTYWHARGYGLFSANPLGAHDFTDGKLNSNLSLSKGESITFRYRVIISSASPITEDQINNYAEDFANKYNE